MHSAKHQTLQPRHQPQAQRRPLSQSMRNIPSTINASTRIAQLLGDVQPTNVDPFKDSVFTTSATVTEDTIRTGVRPTTPAIIEVSRAAFVELGYTNIAKILLPEYFNYYNMVWLRIVSLKAKLCLALTQTERDVLILLENSSFNILEPIMLQLKALGRIETMTKEHLTPQFREYPTNVIGGFGGYYSAVTVDNHNDYEELPCPVVLAEAVRHAVSNEVPGPYVSSLTIEKLPVNANLLGYTPLVYRRNEAKTLAFNQGITNEVICNCYWRFQNFWEGPRHLRSVKLPFPLSQRVDLKFRRL